MRTEESDLPDVLFGTVSLTLSLSLSAREFNGTVGARTPRT